MCYLLLRDVAAQAGDEDAAKQVSEMMRTMRSSREDGGAAEQDTALQEHNGTEGAGAAEASQKLRRGVYPFATFSCRNKVYSLKTISDPIIYIE